MNHRCRPRRVQIHRVAGSRSPPVDDDGVSERSSRPHHHRPLRRLSHCCHAHPDRRLDHCDCRHVLQIWTAFSSSPLRLTLRLRLKRWMLAVSEHLPEFHEPMKPAPRTLEQRQFGSVSANPSGHVTQTFFKRSNLTDLQRIRGRSRFVNRLLAATLSTADATHRSLLCRWLQHVSWPLA